MRTVISKPSPNHSSRRGASVDTVVIHSTGGSLEGSLAWLCNPASKVSAHYVVARDGTVYKLVPLSMAAWHAGRCPNFPNANRRSIGIELVQLPDESPTEAQLQSLKWLIAEIKKQYPIERVVGHRETNPRKSDPYNVDMGQLRATLNGEN